MSDEPEPIRRRARVSVIAQLADLLKAAFANERKIWHAARGVSVAAFQRDKWQETWERAAEFMLRNNIENYADFIHAVFAKRGNSSCCPTPMQCYGPVAMEDWKSKITRHEDSVEKFRATLAFHQHRLRTELAKVTEWAERSDWSKSDINGYIIADISNELTALFRYSLAVRLGLLKLGKPFHESALLQYIFGRSAYDEAWKDVIPASLIAEADAIRASL